MVLCAWRLSPLEFSFGIRSLSFLERGSQEGVCQGVNWCEELRRQSLSALGKLGQAAKPSLEKVAATERNGWQRGDLKEAHH